MSGRSSPGAHDDPGGFRAVKHESCANIVLASPAADLSLSCANSLQIEDPV
jgi:hypothetical protein